MDLENKNILVTGGSLGIGKETAKALVEKGANVLITGRSQDRLIESQQYTNAKNIISFDISNIADISVNAKNCIDILDNRVDVLINNAGTGVRRDLDNLNIDDFFLLLKVGLMPKWIGNLKSIILKLI